MIRFLQSWIWYLGIALELVTYLLAMRPLSRRRYPAFCTYIGIVCACDLALLAIRIRLGYEYYFWCYWTADFIQSIALAAVISEIILDLFAPLWTIPKVSGFAAATIAAASFACVAVWAICSPSVDSYRVLSFTQTFDRSVSTTAAIAAWLVILFAKYMAMPWRSKTYGIAAGLAFMFTVQSAVSTLIPHVNDFFRPAVYAVGTFSALLADMTWAIFFSRRDLPGRAPTRAEVETVSRLVVEAVESSKIADRTRAVCTRL